MSGGWKKHGKLVLLLLGVGLLVYSIHAAGPKNLLDVARQGLAYLPFIALFCGAFHLIESHAQRSMLGAEGRRIPLSAFARATMSSYVASVLLPLGRAGSELVRIAAYAPWVGAGRATAAASTFQVANLLSTGMYGSLCYVIVGWSLGFDLVIAWVLLLHAVGSCLLAALILLVLRRGALGGRVAKMFPSLGAGAEAFDESTALPLDTLVRATGLCLLARSTEVALYAVVLLAVGVTPTLDRSVIAGAIHIVGATAGEAIPSQLGAVEGAFLYFSGALGLASDRSRALVIPILVRVAQFGLAALSLVILHFTTLGGTRSVLPRSP